VKLPSLTTSLASFFPRHVNNQGIMQKFHQQQPSNGHCKENAGRGDFVRFWVATITLSVAPSPPSTRFALQIASHLIDQDKCTDASILRLIYQELRSKIKKHISLHRMDRSSADLDRYKCLKATRPTQAQFQIALRVLKYAANHGAGSYGHSAENATLKQAMRIVDELGRLSNQQDYGDQRTQHGNDLPAHENNTNFTSEDVVHSQLLDPRQPKHCYICRYVLFSPHRVYRSLCSPCGDFNIAQRELSNPSLLRLDGMKALVTGGRVNLGYATSLNLLRCGARVVVSTRYPRDAEARYLGEPDSQNWGKRLKIVGADFRTAQDAFDLAWLVREQVQHWGGGLDILIYNAAQTLTDSVKTEKLAIQREKGLEAGRGDKSTCLIEHTQYVPRMCGRLAGGSGLLEDITNNYNSLPSHSHNGRSIQDLDGQVEVHGKSSWIQSLHEIPYEDLISAHSVNTFVPLILIRELSGLMGRASSPRVSNDPQPKPRGYIINVSSQEGILEAHPDSSAKRGRHVHKNMSKAALNMTTATESSGMWRLKRVAINTVDPGFMSAAPEIAAAWGGSGNGSRSTGGVPDTKNSAWNCPISWKDGAGRVLWPIAVGQSQGQAVWGRFLKHYGRVEVNVGA
jgi:NAD(P)-dependent dehydrogenase (short-subunit alcohol dehydrogenase family)